MACPATVLDQSFHVRSKSMPSRPQPLALRFEEEMQKLRACVASTSSATLQMMSSGLRVLGDIYECINEILHLPSNQQALCLAHQNKWMEKELDKSIKLLNLCTVMRDNLVAMKDHAQELSFVLRRKDAIPESKMREYTHSGKKAQKEIKNCFKSLKHEDNRCRSTSTLDKDCEASVVIRMLMEAREITVSLLHAMFSSLSKPKGVSKETRWSFVSKALHQRKIACEDDIEYAKEAETLEHLEIGLDCLYRQLILNRVSLLNIISL